MTGFAALCASPAAAQSPVGIKPSFTDEDGRQAIFNVQFPDAPPLQPGNISGATVAAEFKRLCLDTGLASEAIGAAAAESELQLTPATVRFLGDRRTPPFDIEGWHGRSADVRIWTGDASAFRRLPFFMVDAGVVITGPMRNLLPQCNLAVQSNAIADFDALVAELSAAIGVDAVEARRGRRWGQAQWEGTNPAGSFVAGLRIDGLGRDSQTLHLGIVYPAAAAR